MSYVYVQTSFDHFNEVIWYARLTDDSRQDNAVSCTCDEAKQELVLVFKELYQQHGQLPGRIHLQACLHEYGVSISDFSLRKWMQGPGVVYGLQAEHHTDGQALDASVMQVAFGMVDGDGTGVVSDDDAVALARRLAAAGCVVASLDVALEALRRCRIIHQWQKRLEQDRARASMREAEPNFEEAGSQRFGIVYTSFKFCDRCCRRFANNAWAHVRHWCVNEYGREHRAMATQCGGKLHADEEKGCDSPYVLPHVDDWPLYDEAAREFVSKKTEEDRWDILKGQGAVSMLDLTQEEADSLRLIEVTCGVRSERGKLGSAPVYNLKKTTVVKAHWIPELDDFPSDRAKAAFEYFEKHEQYKALKVQRDRHFSMAAEEPDESKRTHYIHTSRLLLHIQCVEVGAFPLLYPTVDYCDSDLKARLDKEDPVKYKGKLFSIHRGFVAKVQSTIRHYEETPMWAFLLYDMHLTRTSMQAISIADSKGVSPDVIADNQHISASYWANEQDVLAGRVRSLSRLLDDLQALREGDESQRAVSLQDIMRAPHWSVEHGGPCAFTEDDLRRIRDYAYGSLSVEQKVPLDLPNVFITISPAEWKFPLAWGIFGRLKDHLPKFLGSLAVHMYTVVTNVILHYVFKPGCFFASVFDHVIRMEYQGRGTPHWHIAAWAIPLDGTPLDGLVGRSGSEHSSRLVSFLECALGASIDVQFGTGYLNYIDGYVAKEHDSLDFSLKEHTKKEENWKWRMVYRLLCKNAPCVPEVYLSGHEVPVMQRSFMREMVFGFAAKGREGMAQNDTKRLYDAYLADRETAEVRMSFLEWLRVYHLGDGGKVVKRNFRRGARAGRSVAVGIRYKYELTDLFIGQFMTSQFPHRDAAVFVVEGDEELKYTEHYLGGLNYLTSLRYVDKPWHFGLPYVEVAGRPSEAPELYALSAFPSIRRWEAEGGLQVLGVDVGRAERMQPIVTGGPVFTESQAHAYLQFCILEDMRMRSLKEHRKKNFVERMRAVYALLCYYRNPPVAGQPGDDEYVSEFLQEFLEQERQTARASIRAQWNSKQSGLRQRTEWVGKQAEFLEAVQAGSIRSDANEDVDQFLYLGGDPGTGKTVVLVEAALRAERDGFNVCILVPIGSLVHQYRSRLPEDSNIVVDTFHSAMRMREEDKVVMYAAPHRLRRFDIFFIDEASQVTDGIWLRFYMTVKEMAQKPFVCVAGDFRQLQAVGGRNLVQRCCASFNSIYLDVPYRSEDPPHLGFLHAVRTAQPPKVVLRAYFAGRNWLGSLRSAVAAGMSIGAQFGSPFVWLSVTNKGAAAVNAAAVEEELEQRGLAPADVERATVCADPAVAPSEKVVLIRGMKIRFTRNLDKSRGVVNGAVAEVQECIAPGIFIASLYLGHAGGTVPVLVHPLYEKKHGYFVPCVHGYCTTIRRAQGMTLQCGCLYFDHSHPPDRGYAYVGVSRFKTQAGVYHYGFLRRSDWLPVGEDQPDEQLKRSSESRSDDSESASDHEYDAMEDYWDPLDSKHHVEDFCLDEYDSEAGTFDDGAMDVDMLAGIEYEADLLDERDSEAGSSDDGAMDVDMLAGIDYEADPLAFQGLLQAAES